MKKLMLIVTVFLLSFSKFAFAMLPIEYTGSTIERTNDSPYTIAKNNNLEPIGILGGSNFNNFYLKRGFQFTVNQYMNVQTLTIDAKLTPSNNFSPSDINPFGPSEKMDVAFSLFGGSILSPYQPQMEIPDPQRLLLSQSHAFWTDDSVHVTFKDVTIPFKSELAPGVSYWIVADNPKFSGVTLNYLTKFEGAVTTPEPATWLLMGSGILGMMLRRNKKSKL